MFLTSFAARCRQLPGTLAMMALCWRLAVAGTPTLEIPVAPEPPKIAQWVAPPRVKPSTRPARPQPAPRAPRRTLAVQVWADRRTPIYRLGEAIPVSFRVQHRTAHVTVFATNAGGETQQLFPNPFQRDSLVPAGQTVVIGSPNGPLPLQVAQTAGKIALKAIAHAPGQQREAVKTITLIAPPRVPVPVLEARPDTTLIPRVP